MTDDSVFLSYVRFVFSKWTGLQLAIAHGMGGYYGREKERWFADEVDQFFQNNANLYPDEVEDFLATILNNEFDTITEDGSITEISKSLCKAFEQIQSGKQEDILKIITEKVTLPSSVASSQPAEESDVIVAEESLLESQIERLNVNERSSEICETTESSDGWTEVRHGRKPKPR